MTYFATNDFFLDDDLKFSCISTHMKYMAPVSAVMLACILEMDVALNQSETICLLQVEIPICDNWVRWLHSDTTAQDEYVWNIRLND